MAHPSCIVTLYFFSSFDALAVCETTVVTLHCIEHAYHGFGVLIVTSANADFTFREWSSLATSSFSRSFVGCHICIITLSCGMQIHKGHIIIKSDLASCSFIPAIKLWLSLPGPPGSLMTQVLPLADLPLYTSKVQAGMILLKTVRKKLISSPRVHQINQLAEIATPFAQGMKLLKPSLTRNFNQYVSFKVSFTLTLIVFIVSTVLHLVFMYVNHRSNLRSRVSFDSSKKQTAIKPVLQFPKECSAAFYANFCKRNYLFASNARISPEPPKGVSSEPLRPGLI